MPDVRGDVVAGIFSLLRRPSSARVARVFLQPPSWSGTTRPSPGVWCWLPCLMSHGKIDAAITSPLLVTIPHIKCRMGVWSSFDFSSKSVHFVGTEQVNCCSVSSRSDTCRIFFFKPSEIFLLGFWKCELRHGAAFITGSTQLTLNCYIHRRLYIGWVRSWYSL